MEFIDTHTHLSDPAFRGEEDAAVQRALEAGARKMLLADVDSRERQSMHELASRHPGVLYPMAGLYPGSVDERWQEELEMVFEAASDPGVVAIGEIGLDYHWDIPREEQKRVFEEQLAFAKDVDAPVVVHDREAHGDTMELLRKYRPKGLVHCFSGSVELMREVVSLGMSISLGGVVTFKNARRCVEVAKEIPLYRLLLETDAPYMAPEPYRGKQCNSSMIAKTAEKIAEIRGMDVQKLLDITCENARQLYGI